MLICEKGKEVKVLSSMAGFYIGTIDEQGAPDCRISAEYFKTKEAAQAALETGIFTQRNAVEILWCSDGKGCMLSKTPSSN